MLFLDLLSVLFKAFFALDPVFLGPHSREGWDHVGELQEFLCGVAYPAKESKFCSAVEEEACYSTNGCPSDV